MTTIDREKIDKIFKAVRNCPKNCTEYKVPQPGFVGENYEDTRTMFIGQSPGLPPDYEDGDFRGLDKEYRDRKKFEKVYIASFSGTPVEDFVNSLIVDKSEIAYTNVCKCPFEDNRAPEDNEIENCRPYLEAQFDALSPLIVVTFGSFASSQFLDFDRLTDIVYEPVKTEGLGGPLVIPVFHYIYSLRNDRYEEDIYRLNEVLEKELSKRQLSIDSFSKNIKGGA